MCIPLEFYNIMAMSMFDKAFELVSIFLTSEKTYLIVW